MSTERTEIAFSKKKIRKNLVASVIFVLLSVWILIYQPEVSNAMFNSPFLKYGAGIAGILFFGWASFFFVRKLKDNKPGIIIDEKGITDQSSANSIGLISWQDISGFGMATMMNQRFVMIQVSNPGDYINKGKSSLSKKALQYNLSNFGSPIAISANSLQCKAEELKSLFESNMAAFKH